MNSSDEVSWHGHETSYTLGCTVGLQYADRLAGMDGTIWCTRQGGDDCVETCERQRLNARQSMVGPTRCCDLADLQQAARQRRSDEEALHPDTGGVRRKASRSDSQKPLCWAAVGAVGASKIHSSLGRGSRLRWPSPPSGVSKMSMLVWV